MSTNLTKIVVAIKPWERGLPLAVTHARQLAENSGAELRLVSAVYDYGVANGCDNGNATAVATRARTVNVARADLERLAQGLREWGVKVSTRVVWGTPVFQGILATVREWQASVLVVGAHEPRPFHTRLTDTDWHLIREVHCPLLLVKDPSFDGYRTILAAVDPVRRHEEPAGLDRAVLDAARSFKRTFGSTLRAVHAYPGGAAFELASAVQVAPGVYYGAENVESLHRHAVEELVAEYGVEADKVDLVPDTAPRAILGCISAHRAELVVVGVPKRSGALAAVLGSTAEALVAEAPCDLLLVPLPT